MISGWTVFWVLSLDNIGSAVAWMAFLFLIAVIILLVAACIKNANVEDLSTAQRQADEENFAKVICKIKKFYFPGFLFFLLAAILLPSSTQMAMIYIVPKMSNSNFIKTVPAKLEILVNKKLDDLIAGKGE